MSDTVSIIILIWALWGQLLLANEHLSYDLIRESVHVKIWWLTRIRWQIIHLIILLTIVTSFLVIVVTQIIVHCALKGITAVREWVTGHDGAAEDFRVERASHKLVVLLLVSLLHHSHVVFPLLVIEPCGYINALTFIIASFFSHFQRIWI